MKIRMLLCGAVLAALSFNALGTGESSSAEQGARKAVGKEEVSFKYDVFPIIYDHCLNCHLPGGKGYEKSGLNLSTYESLMKGTKFGPVVKPGDSETSTFTKLLEGTNKGLKMPAGLNASGTLDRQYILTLRKWVHQGAKNN
ncbi:MAG: c-type cytochrome domain-containing protein [Gallionella sp.]|nr:c-type cytochrome domain-containing protein [Gallionella sp.]